MTAELHFSNFGALPCGVKLVPPLTLPIKMDPNPLVVQPGQRKAVHLEVSRP